MDYRIRQYRDADAEQLSHLSLSAIRAIGSRAYSPEQLGAWAGRHGGAQMYRDRASQGHVIFVAVDESDQPVAYALIEPDGHLDRLYNHPDHSRRGLATRLLAEAEQYARRSGMKRLYTEASELARAAFERAGYKVLHRRDFEIEHEGRPVPIHNYAMEKRLD
jgi:putative acetyltransferase